jgi:hypothetical protein
MTCPSPGAPCGSKECCNLTCKIGGIVPVGDFQGCCADAVFGICGVIEQDDGGTSCTLINVLIDAYPGIACTPK